MLFQQPASISVGDRNSVAFEKTLHSPEKHFNMQSFFFFKELTLTSLLTLLKEDTNISSLHFLFGLCLRTNILFIVN